MTYRTRRDLTFVEGGGPGEVVCPAGTVVEGIPEGALSLADATHFQRMIRVEAVRNPNARLVAVRWRDQMRVLVIGDHVVPDTPRRRISVGIVP